MVALAVELVEQQLQAALATAEADAVGVVEEEHAARLAVQTRHGPPLRPDAGRRCGLTRARASCS